MEWEQKNPMYNMEEHYLRYLSNNNDSGRVMQQNFQA